MHDVPVPSTEPRMPHWGCSNRFKPSATVLLLFFLSACQADLSRDELSPPNLVLIVVDALRAANVSFLGYARPTTPNLDALASQSYVFDQAISAGGNTPTAMSALMTGHYPFFTFKEKWGEKRVNFGMRRFYTDSSEGGLPRSLQTLAEQLKQTGYTTAGFVTNAHLKAEFNFHRGFDHYEEFVRAEDSPYGKGETVTQAAVDYLQSAKTGPFFLYLHYMDTHGPYAPPEIYRQKFHADDHLSEMSATDKLWKRWTNYDPQDPDADALADYMRDLYDGEVAYADDCIGGVLNSLQDLDLTDNTIIAITADHGEEFLEHGGTTHRGDSLRRTRPGAASSPAPGKGRQTDLRSGQKLRFDADAAGDGWDRHRRPRAGCSRSSASHRRRSRVSETGRVRWIPAKTHGPHCALQTNTVQE